ncbi:hypothetical protein SH601_06355 [Gracilibacillus sp. S3-1-1]|uniref:Uncharacterized protein n=1 Tax=Gracilibacillus pellucidus TaxID=3095368 RepID=A0ACC6M3R8_9BACI|nr:hypothetical protein [Gracilibacillus sp. S3-1-1]MDX8045606.1 hypothetical protein [Gracilibacillus sp. S3-1-1]
MKKIYITLLIGVVLSFASINGAIAQSDKYFKYPDNSENEFENADKFYEELTEDQYKEFKNAKINIREKVAFEDVNKVLSEVDEYGETRFIGEGIHPKRQMYVFVSISENDKKWICTFDAEKKIKMNQVKN